MNVKRLTTLSLSVALAMILSFLESQIPPLAAVPGVKIGLSNIVTVFLLYTLGPLPAAGVSLVRVILSSLLFSSPVSLIYSLSGALLSFLCMLLAKKLEIFGTVGVSVIGGVMHNAGQIIAAAFVLGTSEIVYYLPVLAISGVVAGIAVGTLAGLLTKRLEKIINDKK